MSTLSLGYSTVLSSYLYPGGLGHGHATEFDSDAPTRVIDKHEVRRLDKPASSSAASQPYSASSLAEGDKEAIPVLPSHSFAFMPSGCSKHTAYEALPPYVDVLDTIFKEKRLISAGILDYLANLRPHLDEQSAINIPDFGLRTSSAFSRTTFPISIATKPNKEEQIDVQMVSLATRPKYASYIYKWIIHLGQTWNLATSCFSKHPRLGVPAIDPDMAASIRFSNALDGDTVADASCDILLDSARYRMEPLALTGPCHVGKSHIMFHVAARLAADADRDVVAVYIGASADLVLDSGRRGNRAKYIYLIEHIVCAFSKHPQVAKLADCWYKDTSVAKRGLQRATNRFFRDLQQLCQISAITAIFFLDNYESMVDMPLQNVIIDAPGLCHSFGFMTVLSVSNANSLRSLDYHKWVITGGLDEADAANLAAALFPSLGIPQDHLHTICRAAGCYPESMVQMLVQYENRMAQGTLDIQGIISEQDLSCRAWIAQGHNVFIDAQVREVSQKMDCSVLQRKGDDNEIVVTEGTCLDEVFSRAKCAVFSLYHGLDINRDMMRDLQFMDPRVFASSKELAEMGKRLCNAQFYPAAARDVLYSIYFKGTTYEQFKWLFDDMDSKNELAEELRLRYFDLSLIETGRLAATAINPLTGKQWSVSMAFCSGPAEAHGCTTFEQAMDFAVAFMEKQAATGPRYYPRHMAAPEQALVSSVILYFPRLGFSEEWMDESVRTSTHHQGSFMLVVTRIDKFSKVGDEARYVGCEWELTWVANDPIMILESSIDLHPTQDISTLYSTTMSWSAKAVKIFSIVRRDGRFEKHLCASSINVTGMKLLVLTVRHRCTKMMELKHGLLDDTELHQHASDDYVGLMVIDQISSLCDAMQFV
ncbi:hypothetical protein GQ54DRAFT_294709 [Martensiomyces pterosporus]|nr:hypothetical protein GQ54DRAFT_294709 [Martensiomyces pterosporus]